jgi:hypothetical protein
MTKPVVKRRSLSRRLCDGLRKWLVAPINDDLLRILRFTNEILARIMEVKRTMVTKEQVEAFVEQLSQKVTKVGDDIVAHVNALRDQIAAGDDLSSTLTKLEGLGAQLQAVDDFIPERPTPAAEAPAPAASEAPSGESAPAAEGDTAPLPDASAKSSGS